MSLEGLVQKAAAGLRDPVTRADTAASLSFSLGVGGSFELMFAHLTPAEMAASRLMNGTIATLLGRPVGKVKDYLRRRTGTTQESHWLRRSIVDGLAYQLWLPTYTTAVYIAGARGQRLSNAVISCAITCLTTSIPYNMWQDKLRTWMHPTQKAAAPAHAYRAALPEYQPPRENPFDRMVSRYSPDVLE